MNGVFSEYGLVLAGGGGKGAFEAGALSVIKQMMADSKCLGISGTSVGGFNAALYAAGSDPAQVWRRMSSDEVIDRTNFDRYKKLTELLYNHIDLIRDISNNVHSVIKKIECNHDLTAVSEFNDSETLGLFRKEGLMDIISSENIEEKLSACDYPVFACVAKIRNMFISKKYYDITNEKYRMKTLLATSVMPVIFNINSEENEKTSLYCDGGLFDTLPISPLYDGLGCENLIVVHLNYHHKHRKHHYRNARMIHIFPGEYLGNMQSGSLNFSDEKIEKLIYDGMRETQQQLTACFEAVEKTESDLRGKHIYNGMVFDSLDEMYSYIDENVNDHYIERRSHREKAKIS